MSDIKNDNEKSILDVLNKNYDNFIIILSGILSIIIAPTNIKTLCPPFIYFFHISFHTILKYYHQP